MGNSTDGEGSAGSQSIGKTDPPGVVTASQTAPQAGRLQTTVKIGDEFYILASSLISRRSTRALASGESFGVFDVGGDIVESQFEALGFFHRDTRHLSRFEFKIGDDFPLYLSSYLTEDRTQVKINLTNPDLRGDRGGLIFARDQIEFERTWAIQGASLVHRLVVRNYSVSKVATLLEFNIGSDFADVFEARGAQRTARGVALKTEVFHDRVIYRYRGLDGPIRTSEIVFTPPPTALRAHNAHFEVALSPGELRKFEVAIIAAVDPPGRFEIAQERSFDLVLSRRQAEIARISTQSAALSSSHVMLNSLLRRSLADLAMLTTGTRDGYRIMAGIPWFATLFGRDSMLTALSTLWLSPDLSVGTLRTMAALQGTTHDSEREEQPGKIVHEVREGEMAKLGEVPFGRYYGSVDSTPLFLLLFGRYVERTGDLALAEELWPNVQRALEWIDRWGDFDGDGYIEYLCQTPHGLANQGWKDSRDAIVHADGSLARPPIALSEVQGYAYAAYLAVAEAAKRTGRDALGAQLRQRAQALREAFVRDFWLEEENTIAMALDADKRPCRVMSSNAAQCLAMGLLDGEHRVAVAQRLLADDMFSGWGIRTLSARERRYNPMSYHNGSVWPHDNALAVCGLASVPDASGMLRVVDAIVDASVSFEGSLPEVFCGFQRVTQLGPVPYPVACHPQAWAAGSIFLMVQAMLGLSINGFEHRVVLNRPVLPRSIDWLRVGNLRVGTGAASLIVRRHPRGSGADIEVLHKDRGIEIEIRK